MFSHFGHSRWKKISISFYITVVIVLSKIDCSVSNIQSRFPFRLSTDTIPLEYDIHLQTEIHRGVFDFYGFVNIKIIGRNTTDRIFLNAKQLKNFTVSLVDFKSGENYENLSHEFDDHSILLIYSKVLLVPNREYLIRISYRGVLREEENGFYRTFYLDNKNNKVWVAATQFQPFYARKAFPCYDEPQFKAKFTLTVTHGANYTALSNMLAGSVPYENGHKLKTTRFPQTPPMSTYTLAFVVSNYESILRASSRKLHFIYSTPIERRLDQSQFALNVSIESLEALDGYFNSYTSVGYPLDKIDHISFPAEVGNGKAYWGLLTYKDEDLYVGDMSQINIEMLRASIVMNHKIVQQWFGNLVTPKWWSYNWMSEGFATFYSYIIANMTLPRWSIQEFQLFDMVDAGYYLWDEDDMPLTKNIESEVEILLTFERNSFCKAANILRMFQHALTANTFHQGVSSFLKTMEYSAVKESDLLNHLQTAARNLSIPIFKDDDAVIKSIQSWTHRSGYPILTVTRNYESTSFTIQQESNDQEFINLWWIPMNFATSTQPDFEDTRVEFILPRIHSATINPAIGKLKLLPTDWLLLNNQQTGYYVVNYDENNWKLLSQALLQNPTTIHNYNKVQIFRDLHLLLEKEIVPIGIVMEMLRYLKREKSLTTWNGATFLLQNLNWKLQGQATEKEFHQYVQELIAPMYKNLDWNFEEDEIPYHKYVKLNLFDLACSVGLPECLKMAKLEFTKYMNDSMEIQPDYLQRSILCTNLRQSGVSLFRKVYDKLIGMTNSKERDDIIFGLSCADKLELNGFLMDNISIGNNQNFSQLERSKAIYYSYFYNKIHRQIILPMLQKNFPKFKHLPSDMLKIFHQMSLTRHASENQRVIRDLRLLNKYLTSVSRDSRGHRFHNSKENLPDKVEDDLLKWLKIYKNKENYFSNGDDVRMSTLLVLVMLVFNLIKIF